MANVKKSGDQTDNIVTVNISAESKDDAFVEWTNRMGEVKEEEENDIVGFKRIESEEGGEFTIKGEIYLEED